MTSSLEDGGVGPGPEPERVIEVRDLHMQSGQLEAVRGLDLHVLRGEVFAFLGP